MPGQVRVNSGILSREVSSLGTEPFPVSVQMTAHSGLGTGIFCTVVLVIGAIALAAYSYFRLNQRTTGFRRFEVRGGGNGKGIVGLPFVCFCACKGSTCL